MLPHLIGYTRSLAAMRGLARRYAPHRHVREQHAPGNMALAPDEAMALAPSIRSPSVTAFWRRQELATISSMMT